MDFIALAVEKIAKELEDFKGGNKETAVSKFVATTLTNFCKENARFAEVVYRTPRTLSDCCAEVMDGCGNSISDLDVYRGAVRHYFPNADIRMTMEIVFTGDAPTDEEIEREPKKKPVKTKTRSSPKKAKDDAAKPAPTSKAKNDMKTEQIQLTLF